MTNKETAIMLKSIRELFSVSYSPESIAALSKAIELIEQMPDEHGDLVDFNDVSKELRKYGYIVKNETTGMQYMEYPIVLEHNPISIPIIVPAERKDDEQIH